MNFRGQLWPIPPHRCVHRQFGLMEAVRETAVGSCGGKHETITLQAETTTPRRRTLSASFLRERTPVGELPLAQRQRKKNEGKARERALCRLFPDKHCLYKEAERARKQDAALRAERGEIVRRPGKRKHSAAAWYGSPAADASSIAEVPSPPWKQQARERVAADMQALEQRKEERAARGQLSRERRAAQRVSGARCGSCATCAELIMFGGQRPQNTWGPRKCLAQW